MISGPCHHHTHCMPAMLSLRIDPANLPSPDSFPTYVDPFEEPSFTMDIESPKPKPLQRLQSGTASDESRGASPQPTHFSVPMNSNNGHRVLRSATVGYIAPEFTGKVEQMASGKSVLNFRHGFHQLTFH